MQFTNEAQKKAQRDDRRPNTHDLIIGASNPITQIRFLLGHNTLENFTQFMITNTDEDIKKLHTTYNIKTITESLSKFLETFKTELSKSDKNIVTQDIVTQAFKRALYPIIVVSIPGYTSNIQQTRQNIITKIITLFGKGIFDNIHRLYDYDNFPPETDFIDVLQYIIQELKKMDQGQTVTLK